MENRSSKRISELEQIMESTTELKANIKSAFKEIREGKIILCFPEGARVKIGDKLYP